MFILNKRKYFNDIYVEIFKNTMISIDDMNNVLTYYSAKPYIEQNKMKFVLSTFLFDLFFVEGALQQKYYPKYKEEIRLIVEAMLDEISNRTSFEKGKVYDVYGTVRKTLGDMALNDSHLKDVNPTFLAAVWYIQFTFKNEYKPDELGYREFEAETAIAKVFEHIMRETLTYLNTK